MEEIFGLVWLFWPLAFFLVLHLPPAQTLQLNTKHLPTMKIQLVFLFVCSAWYLHAQSEKKQALSFHGTASLSVGTFQQQNYNGRQPGFFWSLSGNPVFGVYGHPMPVSMMVSNQQRSINGPFSQIGMSPTYKWAKFHVGVRSLSLSPFSVAGHTFLGGAVELNPGAFRFAVLGGRFQKAREADTSSVFHLRPAYKRLGYGIKVGVGKTRNYFDFIYFKAKDDSTSIQPIARRTGNLTPDENAVLGISSRISFSKRIYLQIDGGASLYTRDTRSELLTNESDDEKLKKIASQLSWIMPFHTSTALSFAGEAGLRYQSKQFQLGLSYRRVEPEYNSMGAWFFQTDVQQVTITPAFSFNKGRSRIQFNTGWQSDNLLKLKPATSQRIIGGMNLSLNPTTRFGIELQANNFQFTQENRYLESDSLRLQQSTLFLNVSPHWLFRDGTTTRTITGSLAYQKSDDYNPYTRQNLRSGFVFGQVTYTWQQQKNGLNLGVSLNGRANKSGTAVDDKSIGLTANAGKPFFKNKLNLQANLNYSLVFLNSGKSGSSIGGGGGISWKALKNTRFYTNTYFISNQTPQRKYQYLTVSGGVEYTF